MNITFDVNRSAPESTIIVSPIGKKTALMVRISPGAFSWYQGAAAVESSTAQPKPSKGPAMQELNQSLSRRMWAFLVPIRETSSVVCWGVKASIVLDLWLMGDEKGKAASRRFCGEGAGWGIARDCFFFFLVWNKQRRAKAESAGGNHRLSPNVRPHGKSMRNKLNDQTRAGGEMGKDVCK